MVLCTPSFLLLVTSFQGLLTTVNSLRQRIDYSNIGCYKDTADRAIKTLEGTDPNILDGNYWTRTNPIEKCAEAARRAGFTLFAVQNGGWCAASNNAEYDKYGKSSACKADGEGGPWANQVYRLTGSKKPCTLQPCKNSGTCTDVDDSSYSCRCPSGYIGRTCETVIPSPCTPNPCNNGGKCVIIGNRYSCRCKPEYGGPNCEHSQATCIAHGDPHYVTFDKRKYNFMGTCQYILAQDCSGENRFTIIQKNSKCGWGAATCTRDITVYLHKTSPEYRIHWTRGQRTVVINGERYTSFPIKRPGFVMNNPSVLTTDIGLGVIWNFQFDVKVTVSGQYKNKMCGLCGDFNGDGRNDWPKLGLKCTLPPSGCFPSEEKRLFIEKCDLIQDKTSPFAVCHSTVDPATLINDCKYDTCRCDDPVQCLCDAVAAYSKKCAGYGKVIDWRFKGTNLYQPLSQCAKTCNNPGEIFVECGSSCVKTCRDLSRDIQCNEQCIPRCQCPGNKVLNEKEECVPSEECPCPYEGIMYEPGDSVAVGNCKTCTCNSGAMSCVDDRECSSKGPCDDQPCKNDGICESEGDDFVCVCVGEYQGETCEELKPEPCDTLPCKNHGICSNKGSSSFSCECAEYFEGPTCEVPKPKPCDSSPCKNGATCYDERNSFYCRCTPIYFGDTCEEPISTVCQSSPCKNGGTCIPYEETFVCKCTKEFIGETCEVSTAKPCDWAPCLNGGTCINRCDSFECKCPKGFKGETCEEIDVGPCASNPCKNGGTCKEKCDSYLCTCPEDFLGSQCEDVKCDREKLDILYVVDGSGSVTKTNFDKTKIFIKDLNKRFDIGQDKTRLAFIQFGKPNDVQLAFNLGDIHSLEEANNAISKVMFKRYQTATGAALKKAREEVFNNVETMSGDRPGVPDVLVLFTDGRASDKPKSLQLTEAEKLKQQGVKIITVGIGRRYDEDKLKIMASRYKDSDKPLFFPTNFNTLDSIANQLVKVSCG